MEISDEKLLREYVELRSEEAFRALVKRHGPMVYGACLRYLRNPDVAEDASQAVFLVLAEKASHIRVQTTLIPWCLTTAKNISRRLARSEARRNRHERVLTPDLAADREESNVALFSALDHLRSEEREAIVLRFVQDLSLAEVGRSLGVSEDAARMRVNRGLQKLRRSFVTPVVVPLSLLERLCRPSTVSNEIRSLALQSQIPAIFAPVGVVGVGAFAVIAIGASTYLPGRGHRFGPPVAKIAAVPTPSNRATPNLSVPQPAIGDLNQPFTLEYGFAITVLTPQATVDAGLAKEKKQIDADLDADRISPTEHDRQVADALHQSKIRRREGRITLSYDGASLLIQQEMTSPDPDHDEVLIRKGQTLEIFPGLTTCYWHPEITMMVTPNIPLIGPSLPYFPTVKDGKLLDFSTGSNYGPGEVVLNKDGSVAAFNLEYGKGRYWVHYLLSNYATIPGHRVAGKISYTRVGTDRTDYVLTSGRSVALPADRFLPDAYLSEDQPVQLNLPENKYKSFKFSKSRGTADEQIAATLARS